MANGYATIFIANEVTIICFYNVRVKKLKLFILRTELSLSLIKVVINFWRILKILENLVT